MKKRLVFTGTKEPKISKREINHQQIARKAAAEGIVLLENEGGILPLREGAPVALYGIGASRTFKGGTGSGDVNERASVSIYEGMKNAGFEITNEERVKKEGEIYDNARLAWRDDLLKKVEEIAGENAEDIFPVYASNPFVMPAGMPVEQPEKTDGVTAFFIISRIAGEGADRHALPGDYYLSKEEKEQLSAVCSYYDRVIVVLNTGGIVDLSFLDDYGNIPGLVQLSQAGMEGGNAFADIISGKVTPSGKLADSWAFRYEDYPNALNYSHNNGDVEREEYNEGIYVGYRYFDSFEMPVRYGFGFGLSYTDFSIEKKEIVWKENGALVTVKVTNTGDSYSGKEVVQIYVSCPFGKLEKEYRRLAAFEKTKELAPHESQTLKIPVPVDRLTSYDEEEPGWVLEEGYYGIWVGNSLGAASLWGGLYLEKRYVLSRTENICRLWGDLEEFHVIDEVSQDRYEKVGKAVAAEAVEITDLPETETVKYYLNSDRIGPLEECYIEKLSQDQLVALAIGDPSKSQDGNLGSSGITVPGSAGETSDCAEEIGIDSMALADGPAGLRLMKYYYVKDGKRKDMPFFFGLEGGLLCPEAEQMEGERYYQYCTAIPVGTLLAQTWDPELLKEVGALVGREMKEFKVSLWLAPGMNIHRNPLCGRNFEYFSEDPLVSGCMAAAITGGVQSVPGCGTTIKHFACNNQEDNRMGSDSVVSERALREIYLKGFEFAVKTAQPFAIMTSYNMINGVHSANNNDLCTKAARCEWGFMGMIMTDWTTTRSENCTASGCMRAGNDLVMPGNYKDAENLREELERGTLTIDDLKACVSRLVKTVCRVKKIE